ncbi:hypothetical protein ABIE53_001743 [Burkholderia sp. OAS925]
MGDRTQIVQAGRDRGKAGQQHAHVGAALDQRGRQRARDVGETARFQEGIQLAGDV